MYARVTKFKGNPGKTGEMEAILDTNTSKVAGIAGIVGSFVVWNNDGDGQVVTVYESESAATAALPAVQEIWSGMADLLAGPPEVTSFENAYKMA
jgi:hypothetical protein